MQDIINSSLDILPERYNKFTSFSNIYRIGKYGRQRYWIIVLIALLAGILFLPWTQNIRSKGTVTTLRPEQRPQEVNAFIGGRVEKWFVKEGDLVKAGDTILQLTEIKVDYLDPQLIQRTGEQLSAKQSTINFYQDKVTTAGTQVTALMQALNLKEQQLRNKLMQLQLKIQSDSAKANAAEKEFSVASEQLKRQQVMKKQVLYRRFS
jgi:multidrug efflux pump subunit AcrA (membrane-fusion protein)